MFWFTLELIVRFIVWPDHLKFFLSPFNIFDLVSTLPYYIYLATAPSLGVIKDIARVFRGGSLFRLFHISSGLNLMMVTTIRSYKEIEIFILYLAMSVLVFSTLVFYTEKELTQTSNFYDIQTTFW